MFAATTAKYEDFHGKRIVQVLAVRPVVKGQRVHRGPPRTNVICRLTADRPAPKAPSGPQEPRPSMLRYRVHPVAKDAAGADSRGKGGVEPWQK